MLSVQGVDAYGIRAIYFLFRMTAGSCLEVENVIKFNGSSKNNKYELGSVLPTGCFHRSPLSLHQIFCSACCSLKCQLEYLETREARVCSRCYQDIIRGRWRHRSRGVGLFLTTEGRSPAGGAAVWRLRGARGVKRRRPRRSCLHQITFELPMGPFACTTVRFRSSRV